jgi:diacylglycerol kinase family enzyme
MRAVAILNAKAGLCLERGPAIAELVTQAFRDGGNSIAVRCVEPAEIEAEIDKAVARGDFDALLIGGGDGSQNLAANKLAGTPLALGVLPFGTVNLLGRDLGIPLEIEAAVRALSTASPVRIDLAEVNGRLFHSLLGLGFFARLASERQRAREQIPFARSLAFVVALVRTILKVGAMQVVFDADGQRRTRTSTAVLITNNRYVEQPLHRPRLDEGLLEINIVRGVRQSALLRAGVDLLAGRWRRAQSTEQVAVREVTITTKRTTLHASIDGERLRFSTPLKVRLRPGALTVLKPIRP